MERNLIKYHANLLMQRLAKMKTKTHFSRVTWILFFELNFELETVDNAQNNKKAGNRNWKLQQWKYDFCLLQWILLIIISKIFIFSIYFNWLSTIQTFQEKIFILLSSIMLLHSIDVCTLYLLHFSLYTVHFFMFYLLFNKANKLKHSYARDELKKYEILTVYSCVCAAVNISFQQLLLINIVHRLLFFVFIIVWLFRETLGPFIYSQS